VARTGNTHVTREKRDAGVEVVQVDGELDLATVGALEQAVEEVPPSSALVIDLSACTFLDSSAVRVLISTARAVHGSQGSVSLVVTDPGVLRVLEIAAIDTLLPVHATLATAIASRERRTP
jgi:anti-sigma B factor antagonist